MIQFLFSGDHDVWLMVWAIGALVNLFGFAWAFLGRGSIFTEERSVQSEEGLSRKAA